ncbi:MAG: N-acetyl-gamma-glutamyl-phosphate reductase [Chloroflexi bacterium]|nr:N-acetyl-gamma-glutamyl-phosphate reductase [Chloroflexota bacterium]
MSRPAIFIDGESGTTGLQIRARLRGRIDIELVSIDPERRKDAGERKRLLNAVDVAILCLPDSAAREAVALVENPAVRILDASSAHRVHPGWTYGFPELLPDQAEQIAHAQRVANPGCYPTGAVALLRPLVDAALLAPDFPITVHAIEGYSGGGRQLIAAFEGTGPQRAEEHYRLYGLDLGHKHVPEMQQHGGLSRRPLFTPSVGRYRQGELVTIPLQLWALPRKVTGSDLHTALAERFAGQRFVRVLPLEPPPATHLEPEALNGTNEMELFVFENRAEEQVLLVARLDNLGKGASGAAVQNLDIMLGLSGDYTYALEENTL